MLRVGWINCHRVKGIFLTRLVFSIQDLVKGISSINALVDLSVVAKSINSYQNIGILGSGARGINSNIADIVIRTAGSVQQITESPARATVCCFR